MVEGVTFLTTQFKALGLVKETVENVREFYPDQPFVVVDDGSRQPPQAKPHLHRPRGRLAKRHTPEEAEALKTQTFVLQPGQSIQITAAPPVPEPLSKRGAAIPTNANCAYHPRDALILGASWFYDWTSQPPVIPGVESVPMLYGAFEGSPALGGNSDWILGANEPNVPGQANLTPQEAAHYQHLIELHYPHRRIVSPSCVHDLDYLKAIAQAFTKTYGRPPRWDAIACHCYHRNVGSGYHYAIKPFCTYAQLLGAEVWVTEWVAPTVRAMAWMLEKLHADDTITRYAWFASRYTCTEPWTPLGGHPCTSLIDPASGELTDFGETYTTWNP